MDPASYVCDGICRREVRPEVRPIDTRTIQTRFMSMMIGPDGRPLKVRMRGKFCSPQCMIYRINRTMDPLLKRQLSTKFNREKNKHAKPIRPPKERPLATLVLPVRES